VVGCLVRFTGSGSAPSAQPGTDDPGPLAITMAAVTREERRSAVPGSPPSGSGSGTVPSQSDRTPDRAAGDRTFFVDGGGASLASQVGRWIAISGIVRPLDPPGTAQADGHATAPAGTLVVSSFRSAVGTCR
jgi:hypothetical protein